MSQLLLQVVIVVAFGVFCFGCGALVTWILTRNLRQIHPRVGKPVSKGVST